MLNKKKVLADARLYLVLDRQVADYERLFEILKKSVAAGVDIVQLRDKHSSAREIIQFSKAALRYLRGRVPFILNDRPDLAKLVAADGVHLGQEDVPVEFARQIVGKKAIIGVSCQNLARVLKAQKDGADYVGFGSVYQTLTKPDRQPMDLQKLVTVVRRAKIPVFAIGGIKHANVGELVRLGIDRVAVTRAICGAKDVVAATRGIKEKIISRWSLVAGR